MDMNNPISGMGPKTYEYQKKLGKPKIIPVPMRTEKPDRLEIGQQQKVSTAEANQIVLEKAMARIRAIVAKAREDLGLSENAELDTSVEATAERIGDFALKFYDRWRENHTEFESEADAKAAYVELIGGAVAKGVDEARGIVSSLGGMTEEVDNNISEILALVQERLAAFAAND